MPAALNVTGERFGRLVALYRDGRRGGNAAWRVRCDCGTEKTLALQHLRRGTTVSCGCLLREVLTSDEHRLRCVDAAKLVPKRHGKAGTPIYAVWKTMVQRCTNPANHDYRWYGAKGVGVCDRWRDFAEFYADMGDAPDGLTLDRIDPTGDYEPRNCRWASWEVQRTNKRRDHVSAN